MERSKKKSLTKIVAGILIICLLFTTGCKRSETGGPDTNAGENYVNDESTKGSQDGSDTDASGDTDITGSDESDDAESSASGTKKQDPRELQKIVPEGALAIHTEEQTAYLNSDYSLYKLYANGTAEKSLPAPIVLEFSESGARYVLLSESPDLSNAVTYYTEGKTLQLYNLKLDTEYYYAVAQAEQNAENTAGTQAETEIDTTVTAGQAAEIITTVTPVASFHTEASAPRNLLVEGVTNVRDLGGWTTADGKKVRQNMLIRSSRFNENESEELLITQKGINTLVGGFGIKTEVDLRSVSDNENGGITKSPLGDGVKYVSVPLESGGNIILLAKEQLPLLFRILGDESNYPLVFHCSIGTDRTGMLAFLINGLLGVSENDLYRDYLFSNFGNIGKVRTPSSVKTYIQTVSVAQGATLAEKISNYLISAGVAAADLENLKRIMLEEPDDKTATQTGNGLSTGATVQTETGLSAGTAAQTGTGLNTGTTVQTGNGLSNKTSAQNIVTAVHTLRVHADNDDNGLCDICSSNVIVPLEIYAINDMHGKFDDTAEQPGVDELTTYLKERRMTEENVLLLSSGDMWQGSTESNETHGQVIIDWMNEMDFASMTIGNHEFDWGEEYIAGNRVLADFPFLAINIYDKNTQQPVSYATASIIEDYGDFQVGIIGAIGDCYSSIAAEQCEDVYFVTGEELTWLVKKEAEKLKKEGADFIVYSIHDGYSGSFTDTRVLTDSKLADYYDTELSCGYVDLVLEGHTHQSYVAKDRGSVYHLQGGGENKGISHVSVDVNIANGNSVVNEAEIVFADVYSKRDKDSLRDEILHKYDGQLSFAYEVLGKNKTFLGKNELRSLVARLYCEKGLSQWGEKYDIVLGGGFLSVRSPGHLEAGDVTYSMLQSLFPFDNELVLCSIKGVDLDRVFFNSRNSNYFIYCTEYGESIKRGIAPEKTYYVVTDTYSSTYEPNNLTEIERFGVDCYARDMLAAYFSAQSED